jgi:hypothetical protein
MSWNNLLAQRTLRNMKSISANFDFLGIHDAQLVRFSRAFSGEHLEEQQRATSKVAISQ